MVEIRTGESSVRATAYHPFWVIEGFDLENRPRPKRLAEDEDEGRGLPGRWVNSHDLLPGDILVSATGERVQVDSIEQTLATEPTPVVNLTIDANPNFTVGTEQLLVHNTGECSRAARELAKDLVAKIRPRQAGEQAAHIIPTSSFWWRNKEAREALAFAQEQFNKYIGQGARNKAVNGFWTTSRNHMGTHRNEFFFALQDEFKKVTSKKEALVAMDKIRKRIEAGEFLT